MGFIGHPSKRQIHAHMCENPSKLNNSCCSIANSLPEILRDSGSSPDGDSVTVPQRISDYAPQRMQEMFWENIIANEINQRKQMHSLHQHGNSAIFFSSISWQETGGLENTGVGNPKCRGLARRAQR